MSAFLTAITKGNLYLKNFTGLKYGQAFSEYVNSYETSCIEQVKSNADSHALCQTFFSELISSRKKTFILMRSRERLDQKMMITSYFIPMLLSSPDEETQQFAYIFQSEWNQDFPDDTFKACTYKDILDGFRKTLTGYDYRNWFRK